MKKYLYMDFIYIYIEICKLMSSKIFFKNKVNIENDLQCTLECQYSDENNPSFILKNICGSKKIELLGSDVYEMDLNLLFSDNFRKIHNSFMIDILKYREKSKFWDKFINGKMNRIVNIINPITKYEYGVKLNIIFNYQEKDKMIFNVIFTDVSIINKIINNTGLLTHDLRSIIKSARNIVSSIESDLNFDLNLDLKKKNEDNFSTLKELLEEAYQMCSKSRTKIIIENINKTGSALFKNVKIYLEMTKYIKKIKKIFPNVKFVSNIKTNICITAIQNDTLWHLFLNIIKNAINAESNEILIIIDNNEHEELLMTIKDNGHGMSESTKLNFLSRKLPMTLKNHQQIDSNRGEGFLLSYKEWVNIGGFVSILSSEINIGTEFLIKIKGIFDDDNFVLNKTELNLIQNIIGKTEKKKILLIDDCLLNLKILSLKIIKFIDEEYKHSNFPILTSEQWQNTGIITIEIDKYIFILLSNGMYGKDIGIMLEPNIIITDIQMPLLNGIQMIKELLENGIKSKILINSAFSDKEDIEILEIIEKYNIEFIEKGSNYDFVEKTFGSF